MSESPESSPSNSGSDPDEAEAEAEYETQFADGPGTQTRLTEDAFVVSRDSSDTMSDNLEGSPDDSEESQSLSDRTTEREHGTEESRGRTNRDSESHSTNDSEDQQEGDRKPPLTRFVGGFVFLISEITPPADAPVSEKLIAAFVYSVLGVAFGVFVLLFATAVLG